MKDKLMKLLKEYRRGWTVYYIDHTLMTPEEAYSQILSLIKENMPKKNICIKGHKLFDDCGSYDGFRCDCGAVDYNKGLDDCMKAFEI